MVLLWLLPAALVTVAAMVWVSWLGREGRHEVDREVALRRMASALEGTGRRRPRTRPGYAVPSRQRDRSTGVAVRARAATPPPAPARPQPGTSAAPSREQRRAS